MVGRELLVGMQVRLRVGPAASAGLQMFWDRYSKQVGEKREGYSLASFGSMAGGLACSSRGALYLGVAGPRVNTPNSAAP